MKRPGIITGVLLVSFLAFGGMALSAQQADQTGSIQIRTDEAGFAQIAKIPMNSAINAALKQIPGKVLRAELENENGYLVYGVEIVKADQQIVDVKVDAGNGRILRTDKDRHDTEGREREKNDNGHERED
jgi:uncharacterized membrane protein YkoI